jgi:hypothetical protein
MKIYTVTPGGAIVAIDREVPNLTMDKFFSNPTQKIKRMQGDFYCQQEIVCPGCPFKLSFKGPIIRKPCFKGKIRKGKHKNIKGGPKIERTEKKTQT